MLDTQHYGQRTSIGQGSSENENGPVTIPEVFRTGSPWKYQYIREFVSDNRHFLAGRTKQRFKRERQRRRKELIERQETLTLWLERHGDDTGHTWYADFIQTLNDVKAELAELEMFEPRIATTLLAWECAADGSIRPEQIKWANHYADSDDEFAEWITASRYKAIYGDWPTGGKPRHPSYEGLPVWKINWLRWQQNPKRLQENKRDCRKKRREIIQLSMESAAGLAEPIEDDDRISLTPLGRAVLDRRNRGGQ